MTPSTRATDNAEDVSYLDNPRFSYPSDEQSPLLSSGVSLLSEEEEEEDHVREVSTWKTLPWWRRPSPYWLIFGTFFDSIGVATLLAPKVAMYTALACRVHRPEYVANDLSLHSVAFPLANHSMPIYVPDALIPTVFDATMATVDAFPILLPNTTYASSSDNTESEPDTEQKCASDPVVQAVVARLSAVFTTSTGILSCIIAGWWGSLSDRYGRRIVLFVSMFGLLLNEFTHVVTIWFMDALPGGYWFPLVGFVIEGLCGGMSSGVAMAHAYLADTTDTYTRSRYFSLSLGLMFVGVAVGPALGGLLIRSTGTILSAFYFAVILHGMYAIFLLFILPEPLTRARARGARLRWRQEKMNGASGGRAFIVLKDIAGIFKPLLVLLPEKSSGRRDWNLFFLAVGYALITNAMGVLSYKVQYAAAQFHWTPVITSYYVSLIGASRALFLTVVLPFVIKYFKTAPVQLPSALNEPLRGTIGDTDQTEAAERPLIASHSPAFDLALTRVSAGLETTAFLGMAVAKTGALFALASTMTSFAAGFAPAAQALALDIYKRRQSHDRREVGKLYGALSVLQALGSQIMSPALYGFVYFKTVATFPQAIMIVSMCTSFLALVSLAFVRVPSAPDRVVPGDECRRARQDAATPGVPPGMQNEVEGRFE